MARMRKDDDKTSMNYWYPIVSKLDIPQPKTRFIHLTKDELNSYYIGDGDAISVGGMKRIAAEMIKLIDSGEFKLPLFIRTDMTSVKWYWKKSCFLRTTETIGNNLFEVICGSKLADFMGLPIKSIVVREYIPMDTLFTAFLGDMPVNPEIRVFVKDGKILCWHWYWIKEVMRDQSVDNWEELIDNCKKNITDDEIKLIKKYAKMVSDSLPGYWSVDFCRAKDKRWILIDMAVGESSWHPESCKVKQNESIST